jgi:hypothetical protein
MVTVIVLAVSLAGRRTRLSGNIWDNILTLYLSGRIIICILSPHLCIGHNYFAGWATTSQ